jgi:hypothetical protein
MDQLVEVLLLSRCGTLLHGGAPQAELATFVKPELRSVDLRYPLAELAGGATIS